MYKRPFRDLTALLGKIQHEYIIAPKLGKYKRGENMNSAYKKKNNIDPLMQEISHVLWDDYRNATVFEDYICDAYQIARSIGYKMNGMVLHIILKVAEDNGFMVTKKGGKWWIER